MKLNYLDFEEWNAMMMNETKAWWNQGLLELEKSLMKRNEIKWSRSIIKSVCSDIDLQS